MDTLGMTRRAPVLLKGGISVFFSGLDLMYVTFMDAPERSHLGISQWVSSNGYSWETRGS